MHRSGFWVLAVMAATHFCSGWVIAAPPTKNVVRQRQWAIMIGCGQYQKASRLLFTGNDVQQLATTLAVRGGFPENSMLLMTDDPQDPTQLPTKANITKLLPLWLSKPGPADEVVVYFSGHGFRDDDGKMYLAPLDVDPKSPSATGIPVEWLRQQIADCKANFKLLILDSCHAGSEKGDEKANEAPANQLGEPFRDLTGVVTLAGSTGVEKSLEWDERQQGLFSFWLNLGLKGNADDDADGTVDVDELYKYVHRNVTRTSKTRFGRTQTPVRIVRTGVIGVPAVLKLQPQSLKDLLAGISEQLSLALEDRKMGKVGVIEFTSETPLGELLGADFGLLGRWCSERVEKKLMDMGEGRYSVIDRRRLQDALSKQRFTIGDLASTDSMKQLSTRVGGMPAVTVGTLFGRNGRLVNLKCQLLNSEGENLATATGTAQLNESEWAMLGRSAVIEPQDRRSEPPRPGVDPKPVEQVVFQVLDDRAKQPHPMQDPNFQFPVQIMVKDQERQGTFKGNDYVVGLRKGEVFEIKVANRSKSEVLMRLLVDGLNTLPERERTKGVETWIMGMRVNLDDARYWSLAPAKEYWVAGFVAETGAQGELREFTIVDAGQSLAARQQFTDQIGLITAAFYAPASQSRRATIGVDAGKRRTQDLTEREHIATGDLLAVVNIHYIDADSDSTR